MNNYLIPANSKKSMLIFGLFNTFDAILFGSGIGVTILLLLVLSPSKLAFAIIDLLPVSITGLLVFPIPNYHNMLTVIQNIWVFYMYPDRRKYGWKGWCAQNGGEQTK